ncbi:MAG: Dam family site-specific DNA-(adenine-N6)-methyltransferase [Verrucomicrobiae bacterium]|nr:Dam family site-specific DNA-(adenine-N6)-methyltransferase [Verrucomicrobiae bacterium]
MKTTVPPLKCQGIKTKLVPWIREVAGEGFRRWIEPFMGSGVVGFNMHPKVAVFADSNPHIINFYSAIQAQRITPTVVRDFLKGEGQLLRNADDAGYAHYRLVRDRFNELGSELDFLFLSRAGFNGMMRFSKKGNWNIPFCKKPDRFAPSYITKIANQVAWVGKAMRPTWSFQCCDYSEIIGQAEVGDLIYCDPPYLGRHTDYYNSWTEDDERRLSQALSETKARFIVSSWHHNDFRENIAIQKYWRSFNILTRDHFYHSGPKEENRRSIVEALICNFDCGAFDSHNHGIKKKPQQLALLDIGAS